MQNAKDELLKHIGNKTIKCAYILYGDDYYDTDEPDPRKHIILKVKHTPKEWEEFLKELNFMYDSGYGGQELFGNIWYTNNNWSERGEYDGAEWWEYKELPEIPEELK
jgi:hypothetical protein